MTFDNYGEWEIDHIKAVASYTFNNEKQDYLAKYRYFSNSSTAN